MYRSQSSMERFAPDLRLPAMPVIVGVALVGVCMGLAGGNALLVARTQPVALLLVAVALAAWWLEHRSAAAGAWFLVGACLLVLAFAGAWLNAPLAPLAVVPVVGAAAMLGLPAALLAAGAETLLLALTLALQLPGTSGPMASTGAAVVWLVLAMLWAMDRRVREVAQWSWQHYQLASRTLDEAYSDRAQHEQILAELVHANRQLGLMNQKLADARLAAEEAQKAKAAFVANVSHEFRTPLNMIIGLIDLLLETPAVYGQRLPPALMEDLGIVCRNCEHLSAMINDVLDLSQVEAGQLALHRERLDLSEVVEKALGIVRPLIEKKGLSLDVLVPRGLPEVYCDRTRIRQVVLNLLSNAARLTEIGGITVRIEHDASYVTVSVSDSGPGITPEDAQKIFRPFYRGAPDGQPGQGGSGLGLSISRQFVELHEGKMWLESAVGRGSTFYFKLPIFPFDAPAPRPAARIMEDWSWHERTAPSVLPKEPLSPRILVHDETGDLAAYCARHWDRVELVEVDDLAEISEACHSSPVHAVLINSLSPGTLAPQMDQARQLASHVPVLGCSLPARAEHALWAGASAYLLKPVLRSDLQDAVGRLGVPVHRVLLVDDNADALRLYARMLLAWDDSLDITLASSGGEALEKLAAWRPDLMLLDIVLPDMDGWHVLAAKQRDQAVAGIPVIMVSAQDPAEAPLTSPVFSLTTGDGLDLNTLIHCYQSLLAVLPQHA